MKLLAFNLDPLTVMMIFIDVILIRVAMPSSLGMMKRRAMLWVCLWHVCTYRYLPPGADGVIMVIMFVMAELAFYGYMCHKLIIDELQKRRNKR